MEFEPYTNEIAVSGNEWTSVKDRLPAIDQKVLGINRYKEQEVCGIETPWPGDEARWCTDEGKIFEPTHWMPLPEAPHG